MKIFFFLLIFCPCATTLFEQNDFCATSKNNPNFVQDQNIRLREMTMNREAYEVQLNIKIQQQNSSGLLMIPIVFHVIHQNGPENVTDSVLLTELDNLNSFS